MLLIEDVNKSLEERLAALEYLQMLVEQFDNAVNMDRMSLWGRLLALLAEPEEKLRKACLWVVATCAQNNPEPQSALLAHGLLEKSFSILKEDPSMTVRHKAMHVISAMVQHNQSVYDAFLLAGGWAQLEDILTTGDEGLYARVQFFTASMVSEREAEVSDVIAEYPLLCAALSKYAQE